MLQSSTSNESVMQNNMSNPSESYNLSIQATIDLESYVDMTFDLTPFKNNKLQDVTSIIIEQVSTPYLVTKTL